MTTRPPLCFSFLLPPLLGGLLLLPGAIAADPPTASRTTYVKLMDVQELWEQERYADAVQELEQLAPRVQDRPYDFVVVHQYLAHTSILMGDNARARRALETALPVADAGLPLQTLGELKLFYGQVLLGEEEFEMARRAFDEWLAAEPSDVQPSHLFSAAFAHFRTDSLARAEELVSQALAGTTSVEENWERLYYQVLFQRGKHDQAEDLLLRMLAREPDDVKRWNMISNHYLRLEDSRRALATMLVTHLQEPFEDPSELQKIVSLYGFVEVPERAARLLAGWVEDGSIEADAQVLRQLGNLWMLARERSKAKTALERAAGVAPDGRTWELLGGLRFEDEEWALAYESFQQALAAGGLEDPARISLLAGLSAMRADMTQQARTALEAAAEDEELRAQARGLLKRLADR